MRRTIGAVGYLNSKPLVYGLDRVPALLDVRFDVPSRCAALLHQGEVALGLIPSIEYLRGRDYRVVPDVAIASDGPVASVALFTRVPLERVRRIALDTSSRTSAALLRVLCAERFGIAPAFEQAGPDLPAMLDGHDAALLIGDPALFADHERLGASKIDLGAEWQAHTGLPFVWAFWAGPEQGADAAACEALLAARDGGVANIAAIAADYGAGDPDRTRRAETYLRQNMRYGLGAACQEALARFYAGAARLGLVEAAREIRFFEQVAQGALR